MKSETYLSSQSCTLPSIKTLFPETYVCPFSYCTRQSGGFLTVDELKGHIQTNHQTLLQGLLDSGDHSRQPSPCSSVSERSHSFKNHSDVLSSPVPMGWYDPNTSRAKIAFSFVKDWDRDELFQAFFAHDPSRTIYGQQSTFKSDSADGSDTELDAKPDGVSETLWKQRLPKRKHKKAERKRRHVHLDLQAELGTTTSEIAYQMAGRDEQMAELVPKSASSKGPGKFDQFFSDVYHHQLSALTVQSEHEGRIKAEARVQELEKQLAHHLQGRTLTPVRRRSEQNHDQDDSASPNKRQRTRGNGTSSVWSTRMLPPSPASSPTTVSSGEWLKVPNQKPSNINSIDFPPPTITAIRPKGLQITTLLS